jgi:hypothetical protein
VARSPKAKPKKASGTLIRIDSHSFDSPCIIALCVLSGDDELDKLFVSDAPAQPAADSQDDGAASL